MHGEFKKSTESGYIKLSAIKSDWTTSVQFGFNENNARVMIPEKLLTKVGENWIGEIEIKKAFKRLFFVKMGAGYSAIVRDYYSPALVASVLLRIESWGEQSKIQRPTGEYKTHYVDTVIDATAKIDEEHLSTLTDAEKLLLKTINTSEARQLWLDFMTKVPRDDTAFNLAIWYLGTHFNLFVQKIEQIYQAAATNQYENAKIFVKVGDDEFSLTKYALMCREEFSVSVVFNYEAEMLKKLVEDGYQEV